MDDVSIIDVARYVPSDRLWFDPMALNVNTYSQLTNVAVPMSINTKLCGDNQRRWGLAFIGITPAQTIQCSPWPDVDSYVFLQSTISIALPFMTLFSFGPLVMNAWYCRIAAVTTVRVVELLRR